MAKINIMALGGLDEKNRRLYILEIDSKIYILESGIYEPLNKDFGIQEIVPNLDYLKWNKDKIKAIFLSSANKMNIGSLAQIVNLKNDIEIYGSKTTIDSLPVFFKHRDTSEWNKNILNKNEIREISGIKVKTISLASIIPGAFGYQFITENGNILYFSDYIFDSISEYNLNPIKDLSKLNEEKNLLLISDVQNATEDLAISSKYKITNLVNKYLVKPGRFVISIYEDEIINVLELMKLAKINKRKIFFKSKTLFNLIKIMISNEEIEEFPIKLFSDYRDEDNDKAIIILSGTRTKLYKTIELLIEANNKNEFAFQKEDTVYFAALPQSGNEHVFAAVTNKISRVDLAFIKPEKNDKKLFSTSKFDIRNMINLIEPEFFMPVSAYYKQMLVSKSVAENNGVDKNKVIIGENGEIFTIKNGIYEGITQKVKEINPMVIESIGDSVIHNELIEERKALGKDGIATISFIYNKEKFSISSDIDIQMKGLVISKGKNDVLDKIREQIIEASDKTAGEKTSITRAIPSLRKLISKIFRENFKKVPMILFNVMES